LRDGFKRDPRAGQEPGTTVSADVDRTSTGIRRKP
jgi:hypothetical protein